MKYSILRSILIGILVGLLFFLAARLVLIVLILGAIYKLSGKGRYRRQNFHSHKMAFAEKVRHMSAEDYETFKQQPHTKHYC